MRVRTIRDLPDEALRDKRALVRLDLNVPVDERGEVSDDTRIRAALPTLDYLIEHGARPVILSHFGRPKGKPDAKYSLGPVAKRLEELSGRHVTFVGSTDDAAARFAISETSGPPRSA